MGIVQRAAAHSSPLSKGKSKPPHWAKHEVVQTFAENLSFEYQSQDGEISLPCSHWRPQQDLPDYEVVCGKGTPLLRKYYVSFWVREFFRDREPQSFVETLYYVTDRNFPETLFYSQSQITSLAKETSLYYLKLQQGVENDYATLSVVFRPSRQATTGGLIPSAKINKAR